MPSPSRSGKENGRYKLLLITCHTLDISVKKWEAKWHIKLIVDKVPYTYTISVKKWERNQGGRRSIHTRMGPDEIRTKIEPLNSCVKKVFAQGLKEMNHPEEKGALIINASKKRTLIV